MNTKTQILSWNGPGIGYRRPAQAHSKTTAFVALLTVVGLIYFDQLTKVGAMCFTENVQWMASTGEHLGLGWHVHQANPLSPFSAAAALAIVGFLCALPVPLAVKTLWTSAAISNHGEMLLRPGTIDFLAVRIGEHVWVANVADIYVLVGIFVLAWWVFKRVRAAKSLSEPM